MNENLPRTLSFLLIAIGVLVCIISQAIEYDFIHSAGWYPISQLLYGYFLSLFIMGAAIAMTGILLALWNSDRRKLEIKEEFEAERRKKEDTDQKSL